MAVARSWMGILTAATAFIAAVLLLAVHIQGRIVDPDNKARIESLKEEARSDIEVQKILQPEMDRQHRVLVRRRAAYKWGGMILLISAGTFLAWLKWLRPGPGEWAWLPPEMQAFLERILAAKDKAAAGRIPAAITAGTGFQFPGLPPASAPRDAPEDLDLGPVGEILEATGRDAASVIPILQAIQARYRYLPAEALKHVCGVSEIRPAQIAGVSTFYGQFRHTPVGEHIVRVCEGTACHVSGAVEVDTELRRCLGIKNGSSTDPSGRFTIERVACIGSCSLAPVITIDEDIRGRLSALTAGKTLWDFIQSGHRDKKNGDGRRGPPRTAPAQAKPSRKSGQPVEIRIGLGSCGVASGAREVKQAIENEVAAMGGGAGIKSVGCLGFCHCEPLVEVVDNGRRTLYGNLAPSDVRGIVRRHVRPNGVFRKMRNGIRNVRSHLTDDSAWVAAAQREIDAGPYAKKQVRVVLENCGRIDPLSIDDYIAREGFRALEECIERLSPEAVIDRVRLSGLRGRGGAGFPTADKWDIARRAPGAVKYVICNGDEGDPGAFMDRAVLEGDPFRVIEGMAIAAHAIGAREGFIYVRREYPIAARNIGAAIRLAEERGYLGERIRGSNFSFTVTLREGAGAFVCGEETALIQSMEGKRGMPNLRPPFPAQSGLWGRPTLINNVETLACLPWIMRRGPEAFAAMGTEKSKGTKVFSLVGKINHGGLIEVPMGITIREIVEEIGGGVRDGRKFKAVLAGGPSGGCIPASLADTRIDFEELASTGSIMGSGGLAVLDDRDCAVEIARYFLDFTQNESCGKCTFCRVGTKRMLEILERICEGKGREHDLETLEDLSEKVRKASLCGLGQTAPNPVLTTLRYFREEYEAHILEQRCPAAQCKALIHYRVLENCTGCTLCAQACPAGAIEMRPYRVHEVADDLCTRCGMCMTACPEGAIQVS